MKEVLSGPEGVHAVASAIATEVAKQRVMLEVGLSILQMMLMF